MKRLVLLLLIFSVNAFAQQIPDMGLFKVRITEKDRNIAAEIKRFKSPPSIETDRLYYWYSSNKIKQTQGGYSGTLLNGQYQEFYLNKNLKEQGAIALGLKTGEWKEWTEEGILVQSTVWKNGLKHGSYVLYDEKGLLKQKGKYKNNFYNGQRITYNDKREEVVSYYKNGQLLPPKNKVSFWRKINIFKKKHAVAGTVKPAN